MKLSRLNIGEKARIISVENKSWIAQRLVEMGFSKGTEVEVAIEGLSKNLKAYRIKNTVIAIRNEVADSINVILKSGRLQ